MLQVDPSEPACRNDHPCGGAGGEAWQRGDAIHNSEQIDIRETSIDCQVLNQYKTDNYFHFKFKCENSIEFFN